MQLPVKILVSVVGLLLVSLVALAVFLPFYFDPNDYKEQIASKVKDETGRDLTLAGDISLSVFPWLGMEIEDATLSNAPGFGKEPFAVVKSAGVRVELLPLLRKEIKVGTVVLDGAVLRLQKNAVGQNNWDDMAEHKKKDEAESAADKDKKDDFKIKSFEVAALEIKDSSVLWDDAQAGSRYQLQKFNFTTGRLSPGTPVLMKSDFALTTGKPPVTSQVALEGKVKANPGKKTYQVENFQLDAVVADPSMPGGKQPIALRGTMDLDLGKQTLAIADLVLEAFTLKITGVASGRQILDAPVFSGKIKADGINPRAVMKAMGKEEPKTTDSGVLKNASIESGFEATGERANLSPIAIRLDDSNMQGSLSVANYSKPAIGFNLKVDEIDLDRYLAPEEKDKAGSSNSKDGSDKGGVDTAKDLNLNGSLSVGKLKIKNLRLDNAVLTLSAKDGIMVVEPFTANFYQGRINLAGRVDSRGSRPSYKLNAQTSNINIEQMLVAMNGSSKISGNGTLNLNLTTTGHTSDELKRASNGTLDFNVRDGEYKGVNLGQKLRQAYALYKGERYSGNEPQTTRFSRIQGTARIHNGVLQNDDLDAQASPFDLDGSGTANFVAETINYLAEVAITDGSGSNASQGLESLVGKTIPVRLTGNLYDPKWNIDFGSLLKQKAQEKLDEEKDKVKQKLLDKLGIGGSSKTQPTPAPATNAPEGDAAPAASDSTAPQAEPEPEKKSSKDALKEEALRRLLGND